MDFLRIESVKYGPLYVRPDNIVCIGRIDDTNSNVVVMFPNGKAMDVEVASDPDEIAMLIERCLPGCRIHRMG